MRMPDLRTPKVSYAYPLNTGLRNMKPCVALLGLLAVSHVCLADPTLPRRGGRALMVRTHLKVGHRTVLNIPVTSFFCCFSLAAGIPEPLYRHRMSEEHPLCRGQQGGLPEHVREQGRRHKQHHRPRDVHM